MDESSSMTSRRSCSQAAESCEDSGWTKYLEDFSNYVDGDDSTSSGSGLGPRPSQSLISDAATGAHRGSCPASRGQPPQSSRLKKLRFRQTRAKEVHEDDSLEDTASSPVNSPKVGESDQDHRVSTKKGYNHDRGLLPQERGGGRMHEGGHDDGGGRDEGRRRTDSLRSKGLCLVPMSMLVHHPR